MATNPPILPAFATISSQSPSNLSSSVPILSKAPANNVNLSTPQNNSTIMNNPNNPNSNNKNGVNNSNSRELNWVYVTRPHVKKKYRPRKKPINQLQPLYQSPSAPLTSQTSTTDNLIHTLNGNLTNCNEINLNSLNTNLLTNIHVTNNNIHLKTLNNLQVPSTAPSDSVNVIATSNDAMETEDEVMEDSDISSADFAPPKMKISFLLN